MRKKIISLIAAGVLLAAAATAIVMNLTAGQPNDKPASALTPKKVTLTQDNRAKDGEVEFVLQSYTCGLDRVGDEAVYSQADGQYCVATVRVTNDSDHTVSLTSMEQHVITADDDDITGDAVALFYVGNDDWYNAIEPGKSAQGKLVFDVPRDARLARFVFHAGVKTSGATVTLP